MQRQFEVRRSALLVGIFVLAMCPTSLAQATDDPALQRLITLQRLYYDRPTLSTQEERDRFCKTWTWLIGEMKVDRLSNDPQSLKRALECNQILQLVNKTKLTPYSDPRFDMLRDRLEDRVIAAIRALNLKLPNRPVVGTLPVPYLNAKVIRVRNAKRSLIILNNEVFRLPYDTGKAVVEAIDFHGGGQGATYATTEKKEISAYLDRNPAVVGNLEFAVLRYLHQLTSPPPDGPPSFNTDLGIFKSELYYRLVDAVEIFVLAHEFAHVLLEHSPERHLSLLMRGSKASTLNVDEIVYSWRQEFEADAYGFLILEAVLRQDSLRRNWKEDPFYPFLLSAPAFFFLSMQLVENGKAILETGHPMPAISEEDVELVKKALDEHFDEKKAPQRTNEKRLAGTKSHPPFVVRFVQAQLLEQEAKSLFFKDHKLPPGTQQVHRFAELFQDTLEILFEKVNSRMKQRFDGSNAANSAKQ